MASGIDGCGCIGPSRMCCVWGEPGCPSGTMASLVPATSVAALTIPNQNVTDTILLRGVGSPTHLLTKQGKGLLHLTPSPGANPVVEVSPSSSLPNPVQSPPRPKLQAQGDFPHAEPPPTSLPTPPNTPPSKGQSPRSKGASLGRGGASSLSGVRNHSRRRHINYTA